MKRKDGEKKRRKERREIWICTSGEMEKGGRVQLGISGSRLRPLRHCVDLGGTQVERATFACLDCNPDYWLMPFQK